jgi:hypothetical protein
MVLYGLHHLCAEDAPLLIWQSVWRLVSIPLSQMDWLRAMELENELRVLGVQSVGPCWHTPTAPAYGSSQGSQTTVGVRKPFSPSVTSTGKEFIYMEDTEVG